MFKSWLSRSGKQKLRFQVLRVAFMTLFCVGLSVAGLAQSRPEVLWLMGGPADQDVRDLVFLPDGEHFVSVGRPSKLWRLSGTELRLLRTLDSKWIGVSRNGLYWAKLEEVSQSENYVVVRRTLDGAFICRIRLPYDLYRSDLLRLAVSSSGEYVATSFLGQVYLWRCSDGALVYALTQNGAAICFSSDDQYLTIVGNGVRRVRLSDGQVQAVSTTNYSGSSYVVCSPNDEYIAFIANRTVYLMRIRDGAQLFAQSAPVRASLAFSPNGQLLAVPGGGGVLVLGVPNGTWRFLLRQTPSEAAAFTPDGARFLSYATPASPTSLWQVGETEWMRIASYTGLDRSISFSFSPNDQIVAIDGVRLLRAADGELLFSPMQGTQPEFSSDGRYLAVANGDVHVLDTSNWQVVRVLRHSRCFGFLVDNQTLAVGSPLHFALYRTTDWSAYLNFSTQNRVLLPRNGQQFVEHDTGTNTLYVRRTDNGAIIRSIALPPEWAQRSARLLAISPDGQYAAIGMSPSDLGAPLHLVRLSDGAIRTIVGAHRGNFVASFTSDGRYILTGDRDALRFWQISNLQLAQESTEEVALSTEKIVFSPSGRLFAYLRGDGALVVARNPLYRVGDVNGDGCIDDADLLAVLQAFGNTGNRLPEDTNNDGRVDDSDLLTVLFAFGEGC